MKWVKGGGTAQKRTDSVRVEMRTETLFGNEAGCLAEDGPAGSGVQFGMRRNR